MSARKRLYDFISNHGFGSIPGDDLRAIGKVSEWARVLRQLSQDGIIEYSYERENNSYIITGINAYTQKTSRAGLSSKAKYRIRNRDGHRCQACGKGIDDGIKLHIDHKIPLDWGGSNNDDNLWVLCEICNQGKKAFFKDDFDPEVMKLVYKETSGYQRLKVLFEKSANRKFPPSIIQGIAGIRDWTRTIRNIRTNHRINIEWVSQEPGFPNGYYINRI